MNKNENKNMKNQKKIDNYHNRKIGKKNSKNKRKNNY